MLQVTKKPPQNRTKKKNQQQAQTFKAWIIFHLNSEKSKQAIPYR